MRLDNDVKIVTFLNGPYKPLFLNFYCNLKQLNLTHRLHVYFADNSLENIVLKLGVKYTIVENVKLLQKSFTHGDFSYWYISRQKTIAFYAAILAYEKFIFTDVDVLWIKDPTNDLLNNCKKDMCFQCDDAKGYFNVNSGFFFVKRNNCTIDFFKTSMSLSDKKRFLKLGDQDILNYLIKLKKLKYNFTYLPHNKYPNGIVNNNWAKNYSVLKEELIFVIHNNWIKSMDKKIDRLKQKGAWLLNKNYQCLY